ncbi:MAG: hypothetical protein ACRDG4_04310, partial [Chloroflexota bacterium]
MRNFCSYCGARNNPEATACLACGSPLDQPSAPSTSPEGQVVQEARRTGAPTPATTRPLQAPGAWYSSQQHTPENPHEPPPGAVNAWLAGQHAAAPQWPLPPAGDAQSAYAAGPPAPFQPPYPPAGGQMPYPNPYGQAPDRLPYLNPYAQAPVQGPYPHPYGQAAGRPAYPSSYWQGPNQNPPAPGSSLEPYGNSHPAAQLPPPLSPPWPTNVGPYGQPYGQPPIDPYAAPARDYFTPGIQGVQHSPDSSYGGYRPTPGYSNFSSQSQTEADYAAGAGYGVLPAVPPVGYGARYSPI